MRENKLTTSPFELLHHLNAEEETGVWKETENVTKSQRCSRVEIDEGDDPDDDADQFCQKN